MKFTITKEDYVTSLKGVNEKGSSITGSYCEQCIVATTIFRTLGVVCSVSGMSTKAYNKYGANWIDLPKAIKDIVHRFDLFARFSNNVSYSQQLADFETMLPVDFELADENLKAAGLLL